MKKLFVSAMFIGLASVAMAQNPNFIDKDDSCKDRGVSVSSDSKSVYVKNNANKPADYHIEVKTNSGTYNHDSRDGVARDYNSGVTYKQGTSDGSGYVDYKDIQEVTAKCYDRE